MASGFQFKQFEIRQEHAAMKVGVDGVLLGAWADVDSALTLLDVGAGTGLLALMAAQRSVAAITAIEPDQEALADAEFNFHHSQWSSRLELIGGTLQEYKAVGVFDHILSNPPFFQEEVRSGSSKRDLARFAGHLPLEILMTRSAALLAASGKMSFIFPAGQEFAIRSAALTLGLSLSRFCRVVSYPGKKAHRILVELGWEEKSCRESQLIVRTASGGDYTEDYKWLTRDFYRAF